VANAASAAPQRDEGQGHGATRQRLGAGGRRGEPQRAKRGVGDFYPLSLCGWSR
jgi:hypothetical protein